MNQGEIHQTAINLHETNANIIWSVKMYCVFVVW